MTPMHQNEPEDRIHTMPRLDLIELPEGLRERALAGIYRERRRRTLFGVTLFGTLSVTSVLAFVSYFQYAAADIAQSGFTSYLSLIFSDSGSVGSLWQTFLLSLIESLPLYELTVVSVSLFALLWSLSKIIRMRRSLRNRIAYAS